MLAQFLYDDESPLEIRATGELNKKVECRNIVAVRSSSHRLRCTRRNYARLFARPSRSPHVRRHKGGRLQCRVAPRRRLHYAGSTQRRLRASRSLNHLQLQTVCNCRRRTLFGRPTLSSCEAKPRLSSRCPLIRGLSDAECCWSLLRGGSCFRVSARWPHRKPNY